MNKIRKKTGELEVFKKIWETRPHVCEVTGFPIYEFNVSCFAHILPKSLYPKFRLLEDNIMLVTPAAHFTFDNAKHKMGKEFDWVLEKADKLKEMYRKIPLK